MTIGRYYYDGEGKRVKKVTDTETTIFVYSSGKLVAEYSTQLSTTPTVAYTTADHLGSPRIITNELGQVKSRRDFMPFGEELFIGVGDRSNNLAYGTSEDDVRQKFTGYQKDNEAGLDFAEARMYASNFGRFTAVDPLLASGRSANPQTFNRFIYVGNNPIIITDPSGLDWYRRSTGNERNPWEYSWFDENPGSDWTSVDFAIGQRYAQVTNAYSGDTALGTIYLNRYGASYLNQEQFDSFQRSETLVGRFQFTFTGMGKSGVNSLIGVSKGFYEGMEALTFGAIPAPRTVDYFTPSNEFEAQQMFSTDLALLGVSVYSGGLAFSTRAIPTFAGFSVAGGSRIGGRTVLSGHGGYEVVGKGKTHPIGTGIITVPEGTSVTVYSRFGTPISDSLGNAIELNRVRAGAYTKTYMPGSRMPNFTLAPPNGLNIQGNPITVSQPTRLNYLLRPNMGACHFAACSTIVRGSQ